MKKFILFAILVLTGNSFGQWIRQDVNTTASLRGLSVVNEKVVWASGTGGTVIKTTDGGKTWNVMTVPGAEKLDFRDIEAFDANTAYTLSIGNGDSSRIYKTNDGGATWQPQFRNTNEKAFFDAIACWDRINCIAMSDPVDRKYALISTSDGGRNWRPLPTDKMPEAKEGEAAFAASGTCLITQGRSNVFLVTGGSDARVFRSADRGRTWFVSNTPIVKGTPGSGIFSIAMRDAKNGVIVGGNYEKPGESTNNLAFTDDGGNSWKLRSGLSGYRSGIAYVDHNTLVAVGTNGTDVSVDSGKTWRQISELNLNVVHGRGRNNTWAVGPAATVVKMSETARNTEGPRQNVRNRASGYGPLPINVTALTLSTTEVILKCENSENLCRSNTLIDVAVTTVEAEEMKYVYTITGGTLQGDGPNIKWDLSSVKPGTYTITAGISTPSPLGWGVWGRTETKSAIVKPCSKCE